MFDKPAHDVAFDGFMIVLSPLWVPFWLIGWLGHGLLWCWRRAMAEARKP